MEQIQKIQFPWPDNWHVHLRDRPILQFVLPDTAMRYKRALVMGNLKPDPITTIKRAVTYRDRIVMALPEGWNFEPLMACYLTDATDPNEIEGGFKKGIFFAAKLMFYGVSTNSGEAVQKLWNIYPVLERMEKIGMPLAIHGEVASFRGKELDPYARERVFIKHILPSVRGRFPGLKIILEHISTKEAAEYIEEKGGKYLGATVTAHHPWLTRTDVFRGGISSRYHCLPMLQEEEDRQTIRRVMTSGCPFIFPGSDSAPHFLSLKQKDMKAPGGIFTDHVSVELYAQIFEEEHALSLLPRFLSENGPNFYGVPVNTEMMTLRREPWTVDEMISVPGTGDVICPFLYDEDPARRQKINWRIVAE